MEWLTGFCEIKKIWILRNKQNLDFAKSTFLTTFIKSGFCEMNQLQPHTIADQLKKSGFCETNQL